MAAEAGFRLYLAGHTHGGQICWPGGHPLITHLHRLRHYSRGLWRHGEMLGYTNTGAGVSGLPVRFHSRGEVALVTLRRGEDARQCQMSGIASFLWAMNSRSASSVAESKGGGS